MSEAEFIAAVEARGYGDVWLLSRPMDGGAKLGVGVSAIRGGQLRRTAVSIPTGSAKEEAFPALLDWLSE